MKQYTLRKQIEERAIQESKKKQEREQQFLDAKWAIKKVVEEYANKGEVIPVVLEAYLDKWGMD